MTNTTTRAESDPLSRLGPLAARLSKTSREDRYDVHEIFDWPGALPEDRHWFSPELSTCYGSEIWETLDSAIQRKLTRLELINFFSESVDLERELVAEVAARIYKARFANVSDFLRDFIAEENDHMWMFAEFCMRYNGGLLETALHTAVPPDRTPPNVVDLLLFGRVLVVEEVFEWYNRRLAADDRLPEIVRAINRVHHKDESRHIAFSRNLFAALAEEAGEEERQQAGRHLLRYMDFCIGTLYNPLVYRDAGIAHPAKVRQSVKNSSTRIQIDQQLTTRTRKFFASIGLIGGQGTAT
ncbi:diiron oxygenase [Nonomuraea sp. NPDC050643]|uniref:diiron oxygenase n=1 Tax=Nonomuraea sp. NPDC050643 TaxID=3155660 RepID=UPI0033EBDABD